MKVKNIFLFFLIAVLLLSGCTFQKRTYRKGYYIHSSSSLNKKVEIKKTKEIVETPLVASSDKNFSLLIKKTLNDSLKTVTCSDSLWSANGTVSVVKILEITGSEVKYKRCSNLNGPLIVVPTSYVSKIKYSNGIVETFEVKRKTENKQKVKTQTNDEQNKTTDEQKINNKAPSDSYATNALISAFTMLGLIALASFVLFAGSPLSWVFWFFSIIALLFTWILSTRALHKIKKDLEHYKGKGMATGALALAIIYSIVVVVLLILFLLYFFAGFA